MWPRNIDGRLPSDIRISLDGNTRSCKSTVLNVLSEKYYFRVHPKPIEEWASYLKDIYKRVPGVGFEFQVKVWLERVLNMTSGITERSGYFQLNTFVKSCFDIDKSKESLLQKLYTDEHVPNPQLMIYMRSDPIKCKARIDKRGRVYEKNITEDYIRTLHELHEKACKNITECRAEMI